MHNLLVKLRLIGQGLQNVIFEAVLVPLQIALSAFELVLVLLRVRVFEDVAVDLDELVQNNVLAPQCDFVEIDPLEAFLRLKQLYAVITLGQLFLLFGPHLN